MQKDYGDYPKGAHMSIDAKRCVVGPRNRLIFVPSLYLWSVLKASIPAVPDLTRLNSADSIGC
jgi:hypothetical protein